MTIAADSPRQSFRPSQLLYDSRYRSITIQVIVLVLLCVLFFWLIRNLVFNLADLGKDIDFGFLQNRAGYDINQTLIPYTNNSSHARAAFVGIINTLLVASLGCLAATVVGTLAGVLRLSKNWLLGLIMTVYVEIFRNVPLVLWIILIYALLTEATPAPRDFAAFGGDDTSASKIFGIIAVTNRGTYLPRPIWGHGGQTLLLVALASLGGVWAWRRFAAHKQQATGRPLPVLGVSVALLFLPTLLAFLALGRPVTFEIPEAGRFNFQGGVTVLNSLVALWLALALYTGAFVAEIVRAGILAVSKGQTEAAFALGLRPRRTMSLVILPQALRVIVPPLISQFLNLTKNSSLAIAVGYMDVKATLGGITINQTGRELEGMLLLAGFYLAVSLVISAAMNFYNHRIAFKER